MNSDNHNFSEKRTAARYPVIFFVEFENGTGWTRNVSTTGVCIETNQSFVCGVAIRFVLNQPDREVGITRMQCNGVVVRAEQVEKRWRLGVLMEAVGFE